LKFITWVDGIEEYEVSVQKNIVQKNMLAHKGASSCWFMDMKRGNKGHRYQKEYFRSNTEGNFDSQNDLGLKRPLTLSSPTVNLNCQVHH